MIRPAAWPLWIGAPVLLVCWAALAWNASFGALSHRLHIARPHDLVGKIADAPVTPTLAHLIDGSWQKHAGAEIARDEPFWRAAVRLRAQISYFLFDTSPIPTVMVGRDRELYERPYVIEYCNRNRAAYALQFAPAAQKLRRLQDFYAGRGTPFLYVITPSKAAIYPEYIPAGYPCLAPEADRTARRALWRAALDQAGVHYVDAAEIIARDRTRFGIDLFPRSGTHWNALGTALAAQAVTEALNRVAGRPLLTPFRFTWTIDDTPRGRDRDILDLMNLMSIDPHYPVADVTFDPPLHPAPANCRPAVIAGVGGSFLGTMVLTLERVGCPPDFRLWNYWHRDYVRPTAEPERLNPSPPDDATRRHDLLTADAVILEENETLFPVSEHGTALEQFAAATAGR